MTLEQNKAVMRAFCAANGHVEDVEPLLAPDFRVVLPDGSTHSREEFLQRAAFFEAVLSDMSFEIDEMIAEGDMVATWTTYRATHTGELEGLAPTGETFSISAVMLDRIEGGKIVEHRSVFDMYGMMRQIGAMPQPSDEKTQG